MRKLLSSLFVLIALAGGVLAGVPVHSRPDGRMAKCCTKAKSTEQSSSANAAGLCCAVICPDPAPTSSAASFNLSPAIIIVTDSVGKYIAELLDIRRQFSPVLSVAENAPTPQNSPPKYLKHHSFLI